MSHYKKSRSESFMVIFIVLVLLLPLSVHAVDIYVDRTLGDDAASGLSWVEAKKTIKAGLDLSETLAGLDTVHVAAASYYESIDMVEETTLLGGYPAGGGVRDPAVHETFILSPSPSSWQSTWSYIVLGADNATIDGFWITGLFFMDDSYARVTWGAGIKCMGTSPTITNNKITGCYMIGADDVDNVGADMRGGGILCINSSAIIKNNTISGNHAEAGGVVSYDGFPQGGDAYGGGICCWSSSCTIEGNIIQDNVSTGGVGIYYGSNGSSYGGGISITYENCVVKKNIIRNNSASYIGAGWGGALVGGGIYSTHPDSLITNNLIYGNTADYGAGLYTNSRVVNNTIYGNDGDYGSGLYIKDGAQIINNIILNNTNDAIYVSGAPASIFNNDIYGHAVLIRDSGTFEYTDVTTMNSALYYCMNNISCPPDFDVPSDYLLLPISCCIDAGTWQHASSVDFDGDPRPQGAGFDIGADEYPSGPPVPAHGSLLVSCILSVLIGFSCCILLDN